MKAVQSCCQSSNSEAFNQMQRRRALTSLFSKGLAQALSNLGQQGRERHRQRDHQEQLAHHRLLQQVVRHGLPAAQSTGYVSH